MQNENGLTPAQKELESTLAGLSPSSVDIPRDRLMFRAGQASARRRTILRLPLSIALAVMLTASLLFRPTPPPVERIEHIVYVPVEMSDSWDGALACAEAIHPARPQSRSTISYLNLRDKVLTDGVEALPKPVSATSAEPVESLEKLLEIL
jgi:hypothetical protein